MIFCFMQHFSWVAKCGYLKIDIISFCNDWVEDLTVIEVGLYDLSCFSNLYCQNTDRYISVAIFEIDIHSLVSRGKTRNVHDDNREISGIYHWKCIPVYILHLVDLFKFFVCFSPPDYLVNVAKMLKEEKLAIVYCWDCFDFCVYIWCYIYVRNFMRVTFKKWTKKKRRKRI